MTLPVIKNNLQKGFTLIELLVVIGILAVLLSIVLVAINPGRQFALANNTTRLNGINSIMNAIYQYAAENKGALPPGTPAQGATLAISTAGTGAAFCNALVPNYLAGLPVNPTTGNSYTSCAAYTSGYSVSVSTVTTGNTPRVTVFAPTTELDVTISVTR